MTDVKPWFASRAIWGSLIALVAALAGVMGIEIAPGTTELWTDSILQFIAVVASLYAIFGRTAATRQIE